MRRALPWRRRLLSDVATASLWGAWLWLCRPLMSVLGSLRVLQMPSAGMHLLVRIPMAIERGVLELCIVSGCLWLWQRVGGQAEPKTLAMTTPDYARFFGLSETQLHYYRASQVCVVHHDAEGEIIGIDAVAPAPPPTAPVATPPELPVREPELAAAA